MPNTKKSKIFLAILFLVALFFVDCSFEDKLGSEVQDSQISGGKKTNLPTWNKGYHRNEISDGSYIPKIYIGRYSYNDDTGIDSWVTLWSDKNGDYIINNGGSKEYVKDFKYLGENTWEQVIFNDGYYLTTWQYNVKFEKKHKNIFIYIY